MRRCGRSEWEPIVVDNAFVSVAVLAAVFNVEKGAEGGAPPVTGDLAHNLCAQMAVVGAIGLPGNCAQPERTRRAQALLCLSKQPPPKHSPSSQTRSGYYVAVWLMDSMGRRRIQMQGFLLMAITFATLGLAYEQLELSAGGSQPVVLHLHPFLVPSRGVVP
eukprot:scaffold14552_cov27-Tisochrysis_lutea.AAC.1